jgi:hypothetical protein
MTDWSPIDYSKIDLSKIDWSSGIEEIPDHNAQSAGSNNSGAAQGAPKLAFIGSQKSDPPPGPGF